MVIWKKFLSRKFLIQLGGFVFSVLAVLYGEDNEALLMVGQIVSLFFLCHLQSLKQYLMEEQ